MYKWPDGRYYATQHDADGVGHGVPASTFACAAVTSTEKRQLAEARLEPILAVLDHPLRCLLYHLLHASGIDLQTAERELRKQGWWLH